MLRFIQAKISQNVLTCKFIKNKLLLYRGVKFITKREGFHELQRKAGIVTKWGNFNALQSRANVAACGAAFLCYKVGQLLSQSGAAVTKKGSSSVKTKLNCNKNIVKILKLYKSDISY